MAKNINEEKRSLLAVFCTMTFNCSMYLSVAESPLLHHSNIVYSKSEL